MVGSNRQSKVDVVSSPAAKVSSSGLQHTLPTPPNLVSSALFVGRSLLLFQRAAYNGATVFYAPLRHRLINGRVCTLCRSTKDARNSATRA